MKKEKYMYMISVDDSEVATGEIMAKNLKEAIQKVRDKVDFDIHAESELSD